MVLKSFKFLIILIFLADVGLAQERDTSFAIYSTYIKTRKKYPEISMVNDSLPKGLKEKRNFTYCTTGNRELKADIFYPKRKVKGGYPAVVLVHGGGWRSGDRSQNIPLAQRLAAKGYVVVNPEYRLSTEALYPAAVYDVKAALRWTRANARKYKIDSNNLAILGFSAGGQLAALVGTTNGKSHFEGETNCSTAHSSSVQAIVDLDGILAFIHPESGEGDDSKSKSAATYWFGASKKEKPELWNEASALRHVTPETPPILFINSSVGRMHAGRDDMIKKLNQFNIYSEVHTFKDAPHVFPLFNPWFDPTLTLIADFLDKTLKKK